MVANPMQFSPRKWSDYIGNISIKASLRRIVTTARGNNPQVSERLLLHGASRSGKTSGVKLMVRSLLCQALDPNTLDPCNACSNCTNKLETYGHWGLFPVLQGGRIDYFPVDGTAITATDLRMLLADVRQCHGIVVVYIDEAHRCAMPDFAMKLLKPVEETDCIWILSVIDSTSWEPALLNRFVELATAAPQVDELAHWLLNRCKDFAIPYDEEALVTLARKARLPGLALKALHLATLNPDCRLTVPFVDGWQL